MRMILALIVMMAACLVILPALMSDQPYQPSEMEQQQQIQPIEQPQQQAPDSSMAASWEPFLIFNRSTGEIEEIPVEQYVTGALCAEMPATFHSEALKAQAVSAHTWALYCQQQADNNGQAYDFSADPENWQGYVTEEQARERFGDFFDEYWGKVSAAAQAVLKEILVDEQQQPIVAAYHAISAGWTESPENVWGTSLPCLAPVDSSWDIHAQGYEQTVSFTADEVREQLQQLQSPPTLPEDPAGWLQVMERSGSGYVTLIKVGDLQLTGIQLREALGLRSSDFDFSYQDGSFTFTTLGYGHGVGLSQYGADYLARQGQTYQEILAHYYPESSLIERT